MNENNTQSQTIIPKLRVYLLFETENSDIFLVLNEKTPLFHKLEAKKYRINLKANLNLNVYSFSLPDMNLIADSNEFYFELVNRHALTSARFISEEYFFDKSESFSYYYIMRVNFKKNSSYWYYKDPKGSSLSQPIRELYYFFFFRIAQYIENYREIITSGFDSNMLEDLLDTMYKEIQDLIGSYKKNSHGGESINKVCEFLLLIEDFIQEYSTKEEYPEVFLMIVSLLGGVIMYEQFINQELPLKSHGKLLQLCSKANEAMIVKFATTDKYPLMRGYLINGFYFLIDLAIKEGISAWVAIGRNEALLKYLFTAEDEKAFQGNQLFEKIGQLIRRSGKEMKTTEGFVEAKTYLMSCYYEFYNNNKKIAESILVNLQIISPNKEQLISPLIEFIHSESLSLEMLKAFKEIIRRKKLENNSIENMSLIIQQLSELIISLEQKVYSSEEKISPNSLSLFSKELKSLLYELLPNVKYLFLLMTVFQNKNDQIIDISLFKKAMRTLGDVSLDDYAFITGELQKIPKEIKQEILDNNFHKNLLNCINKVRMPFENEKVRENLVTILLNNDLFIAGSLGCVKDFIIRKPTMEDLEFIISYLVVPQKTYGLDSVKDIFIRIKAYLMGTYTDIHELILKFSDVIRHIEDPNDYNMKKSICDQFWAEIYRGYSTEIFIGLCQVFNCEEEAIHSRKIARYDDILELSYIQFMKDIIRSMSTNIEQLNQLFNSVACINLKTKPRFILSNSISTESIINSLLDIIVKTSDPQHLKPFLIKNPNQENFWYKLITAQGKCTSFRQHKYVISVKNCIMATCTGICNGTLMISDFILISKQTPVQRAALAAYIEAVSLPSEFKKYLIAIEAQMDALNMNLRIISEVEKFLNVHGSRIEIGICENIFSFLRKLKQNYKSTELQNFVLTDNILKIKDIIIEVNNWTETVIFKNVFQDKLNVLQSSSNTTTGEKASTQSKLAGRGGMIEIAADDDLLQIQIQSNESALTRISLDSFLKISIEAINYIKANLTEITNKNNFTCLPLKRIVDLFRNPENPEKECKLLETLVPCNVINLTTLFKKLSLSGLYLKFSATLIKLDDWLNFKESNKKLFKNFIDLMYNFEVKVNEFLTLINNIETIRRKYSLKYDIDNILFLISENQDLINFLLATPEEDIQNMMYAVDEQGDSFIRVQTIIDLWVIGSFIRKLKMKNSTEKDFITSIISAIDTNPSFTAVDALIDSCSKQYTGIKHLHCELSNREEASKIKVREICNESLFSFKFNSMLKEYEVMISYKKKKKISFSDLCDLRDRVLLLLYSQQEKLDDKLLSVIPMESNMDSGDNLREMLKSFIKLVELSEKVLVIMNDLFWNGYPELISPDIDCTNGCCDSFQQFLDRITEMNTLWSDHLKEAYTKYYPLTYYHGNQFWEMEKILSCERMNLNEFKTSTGYFLLKYACKDINVEIINQLKYTVNNSINPKERIFKLGAVLSQIIDVNYVHSKPIILDQQSMIDLKITPRQVLFTNPTMMKIFHYLLSIHFTIESSIPSDIQLLYCTNTITFHELNAFLCRFAYCPVSRLFSIIRVENLPFELQNFLVDQVNKLIKSGSQISLLNVICCDQHSYIYHQFDENTLYVKRIRDFEILDESVIAGILKKFNLNVCVFRSDDTGAGKTFSIQTISGYNPVTNQTEGKMSAGYVNFPIMDSINVDKISERLFQLNKFNNTKSIHVTISGVIDNFEMLDLILFKYTIIGCMKHETYVSYRNSKDPLFIEISNTYNDILYHAISIIPLIPNNGMIFSTDNLKTLDPTAHSNGNFSPLQIVANYLHLYDQGTICVHDVNPTKTWKIFTKDEILGLLNKYFIKDNPDITFRQVWTFVNVLSNQLLLFGNNCYFTVDNIQYIHDESLKDIRAKVVESLLAMTGEFTTRSIKLARVRQKRTNSLMLVERDNLNDEKNRIDEINSLSSVMSWSESNHLLIIFHEDGMCMTPVYRLVNDVPKAVKNLMESQKSQLEDYQRMSHTDLLKKLLTIVGKKYSDFDYKTVSYVLTADNFLKMLLIITRARANVPIVMMGETGCGKTALVRFLARSVMLEAFEVINFHAGITEEYLIGKMTEIVHRACNEYKETRVWVFLDEINTCDCLGLITEIICQKSLQGAPLPKNLIFISACNPYKIRKDTLDVGLIKQRVATKLVYRVHPLPDSLIDYVWDFGSLSENDEKLYISNLLSQNSGEFAQIAIELVCVSQAFVRQCGENFSVSLRDVARFKILHEWFFNMITDKNKETILTTSHIVTGNQSYPYFRTIDDSHIKHNKVPQKSETAKKSLLLALMMCYYNRISKNSDRMEYKRIIAQKLNVKVNDIESMITEEQKDIVFRMELPPAIAMNRALLENVFTLMVCAINKIPLFICGKPGCSKSLSVQLLVSNLRGHDSTDPWFKKLPRILAVPYQGSESSTSEGIQRIFQKAENIIKNYSSDKKILPLIIFDEIGLAEISKNNPLKILHSLLEPENPTVAFVGISNWRLDASKMNRAIYVARPDPDIEDLENTALSIFEYYIKDPQYDEKLIMKALVNTYDEFKTEQKQLGIADFHGTRDFYSLIKQIAHGFKTHYSMYNQLKLDIVKDSLCRNFGGLNNSIVEILQKFAKHMGLESDFADMSNKSLMEVIKGNLNDSDSRYLLLFTNGSSASYILDNYLKQDLKERIFLLGSEFENDKDREEHSFRLLSDIILYMENGSSIIMKNLDQIYGALYVNLPRV